MVKLDEIYESALDVPYATVFRYVGNRVFQTNALVIRTEQDGGTPAWNDTESVAFELLDDSDGLGFEYISLDELEVFESAYVGDNDVYRPVLEERKVGKVQVHLVDQGFPNALMEVAKVMTWAGKAKGYKPHDWKNLPDAENALEGAASRHRMVHNQQRQGGAALLDCTDHESLILHKAHEAFNVLAELELILTGKIA